MVAKISTGGNMFGALAYNQNKVDSGEAKVLFSNRMLLGEDGNFVSIRPRACFSPSYNKVKSQTKHVWLLTLL